MSIPSFWTRPDAPLAMFSRRPGSMALLWLLLMWGGCASPDIVVPRVVVLITADPDLAADATRVRLASSFGKASEQETQSAERWPVQFVLAPGDGQSRGSVEIDLYADERLLVRRRAVVAFPVLGTRYAHVHLSSRCAALFDTCELGGNTCVDCGECAAPGDLPLSAEADIALEGGPHCIDQPDAGTPSPSDAGDVDGSMPGDADDGGRDMEAGPPPDDAGEDAGTGDAGPALSCPLRLPDALTEGRPLAALDFDADGLLDLAVGEPDDQDGAGAVLIYRGRDWNGTEYTGTPLRWDQYVDTLLGVLEPGDLCGAALATGDFNGDGTKDLAVGCPGETRQDRARAGIVYVLFGMEYVPSAEFVTGGGQAIDQLAIVEGQLEDGDLFGSSLAALDLNGDQVDDLAVGVPGESDFDRAGTQVPGVGIVNCLYGRAGAGLDVTHASVLSQERPVKRTVGLVPGRDDTYEFGDAFGHSVSAAYVKVDGSLRPALLVGAPGEDEDEGVAHLFISDPTSSMDEAMLHVGLHGDGTPSGRFGHAAVALDETHVFVSAPMAGGGRVARFDLTNLEEPTTSWLAQPAMGDDPGPEIGDAFGWSLALSGDRLIVSAPGEELRGAACNTGVVDSFLASDGSSPRRTAVEQTTYFGFGLACSADSQCAMSAPPSVAPILRAP